MKNSKNTKKTETDGEKLDRLVAEKLKSAEWFEFEGQNCELPCEGWDGIDRRCQCGNRRVTWSLSYNKDYVYAEAW